MESIIFNDLEFFSSEHRSHRTSSSQAKKSDIAESFKKLGSHIIYRYVRSSKCELSAKDFICFAVWTRVGVCATEECFHFVQFRLMPSTRCHFCRFFLRHFRKAYILSIYLCQTNRHRTHQVKKIRAKCSLRARTHTQCIIHTQLSKLLVYIEKCHVKWTMSI